MAMTESKLKQQLCEVSGRLYERGLISSRGGNVSARLPGKSEFWITGNQADKFQVLTRDLVKVSVSGRKIKGVRNPSIETPFHSAIYRTRHDVNAVVHAHNPVTMALALAGIRLKPQTVETKYYLKKVGTVGFAEPGSKALAHHVGKQIARANTLILYGHGVVGVGSGLIEAEHLVELLEEAAITQLASSLVLSQRRRVPG